MYCDNSNAYLKSDLKLFVHEALLFQFSYNISANACEKRRKQHEDIPKIQDKLKKEKLNFRSSNNMLKISIKHEIWMLSINNLIEY